MSEAKERYLHYAAVAHVTNGEDCLVSLEILGSVRECIVFDHPSLEVLW